MVLIMNGRSMGRVSGPPPRASICHTVRESTERFHAMTKGKIKTDEHWRKLCHNKTGKKADRCNGPRTTFEQSASIVSETIALLGSDQGRSFSFPSAGPGRPWNRGDDRKTILLSKAFCNCD
jgi:hypothetical protein